MTDSGVKIDLENKFSYRPIDQVISESWTLWESCRKKHLAFLEEGVLPDLYNRSFKEKYVHIRLQIEAFQREIGKESFINLIDFWIQSLSSDEYSGKKMIDNLDLLLQKQILILIKNGRLATLEDIHPSNHFEAIENIRCVKEWNLVDKEKLVKCYLQLFSDLSKYTLGLIPRAYDPDREKSRNKVVEWDLFIQFVQRLSSRDALIAKLLYFGAPSIDAVINTKGKDIDISSYSIFMENKWHVFPKHLILDIFDYLKTREVVDFIFLNVRGEPVERTNLIHTFSNASLKIDSRFKITPSSLLKYKSDV